MIKIHESAKENYNRKAEGLVSLIKPYEKQGSEVKVSESDLIAKTITEKDIIGEIELNLTNGLGEELGAIFFKSGSQYALLSESFNSFSELVASITKNKVLKNIASYSFTKKILKEWVGKRFKGEISTDQNFSEYFLTKLEEQTNEYEFWIPIPYTIVSRPIKIGNVDFRAITSADFDKWFKIQDRKESTKQPPESAIQLEKRLREDYQGFCAGYIKVLAEPQRASEISYEYLRDSLSLLRVFSPVNLMHELVSVSDEYGKTMTRKRTYFMQDATEDAINFNDGLVDKGIWWELDGELLNFIESYVPHIEKLLDEENVTPFKDKLLNSLMIYSRNILRHDVNDKVLYILVALESLLLKDENEPIQQNVGERLAFMMGKTAEERMGIVSTFKRIYAIRSKFVHHGRIGEDDKETLRSFMMTSWLFFLKMIEDVDKYEKKEAMIMEIDRLKYK